MPPSSESDSTENTDERDPAVMTESKNAIAVPQQFVVLFGAFGVSWTILCSMNLPTGHWLPSFMPVTHVAPWSLVSVSSIPMMTRTSLGVMIST